MVTDSSTGFVFRTLFDLAVTFQLFVSAQKSRRVSGETETFLNDAWALIGRYFKTTYVNQFDWF